jgi:hypothetical protein
MTNSKLSCQSTDVSSPPAVDGGQMKNEILPGKSKLEIEHVRGERIEQAVNELLSISPDTKRKLQFLITKQGKVS